VLEASLPADLQKFIARYIASVEKLEVLLLLFNAPDKDWSPAEVYQKIQSNLKSVEGRLKELLAEGLAARNGNNCFRFQSKSPELAQQVGLLNSAYQNRRLAVIQLIFSETTEELRRFSDAFRLRKDEP
jgi:hypothetical protein